MMDTLNAWLTTEARARLAEGMRRAAALVAESGATGDQQALEVAEYARSMLPGSVKQVGASDIDLLRRARAEVVERAARAAGGGV
jgi:indole-3-glycerol phosphate synthase